MKARVAALLVSVPCFAGCGDATSTEAALAGPPVIGGKADGASDALVCPADATLNAGEGSARRCYDASNGQFVATQCCEDVCQGAGIREQSNGDRCAWLDEPGQPGATQGQFAPQLCCDLNESLACGRAELEGSACIDPDTGGAAPEQCCETSAAECHPTVASVLRRCVYDASFDEETGLSIDPLDDTLTLFDACSSSLENLAPELDAMCAWQPELPFCGLDFETVARDFIDPCVAAERPAFDCTFGVSFSTTAAQSHIAVVDRTVLDLAAAQAAPAPTQAQIIAAVAAPTLAEAFERTDGNEVNRVELFDLSQSVGFTAIEFGAGDTSVGAIFRSGTAQRIADIGDGDISRDTCDAPLGTGGNLCRSTDDCATGLRCEGRIDDANPISTPLGLCVDTSLEASFDSCSDLTDCDQGYCVGLVAFGGSDGMCAPGWMFGERKNEDVVIPADGGSARSDVLIYGQASVPVDVEITLDLFHDVAASDLTVELLIPGSSDSDDDRPRITVWPHDDTVLGSPLGGRVTVPVRAFGDESINGAWTIVVTDANVDGQTGGVHGWSLGYNSRWD